MVRGSESLAALDGELVRPDAFDRGAERDEEMTEVLHVRLACGVAKNRVAPCRGGGSERLLRGRDTRLVEEDIGAAKTRRTQSKLILQLECDAEAFEREKMRIEAPSSDDI